MGCNLMAFIFISVELVLDKSFSRSTKKNIFKKIKNHAWIENWLTWFRRKRTPHSVFVLMVKIPSGVKKKKQTNNSQRLKVEWGSQSRTRTYLWEHKDIGAYVVAVTPTNKHMYVCWMLKRYLIIRLNDAIKLNWNFFEVT